MPIVSLFSSNVLKLSLLAIW